MRRLGAGGRWTVIRRTVPEENLYLRGAWLITERERYSDASPGYPEEVRRVDFRFRLFRRAHPRSPAGVPLDGAGARALADRRVFTRNPARQPAPAPQAGAGSRCYPGGG